MNKRKICLITNWYPTDKNPFQGLFFREQAIALAEYYDFIVLHYETGQKLFRQKAELQFIKSEHNIKEYTLKISVSRLLGKARSLFRTGQNYNDELLIAACKGLEKEGIDVFYCVSAQFEAVLTKKIAYHFKKPYVVSEHAPVPWPGKVITEEDKIAIQDANLLFLISYDKMRQIMMQGIVIPKYRYVGNMVDDNLFFYKTEPHEITTFIAVGSYVFYKNYDMMIDVFNRLTEICNAPFRLRIVGYKANEGYFKDAEILERKIAESLFSESVDLIAHVSHDNMPFEFNKADAFVMTSVQEGQPVSAIEAGCCGLPIFSTRCGGAEDYVTEDIGRIAEIWDVESFARNLRDYLEKKTVFDADHIRHVIKGRFGKEAFVHNMKEAFDQVLNEA